MWVYDWELNTPYLCIVKLLFCQHNLSFEPENMPWHVVVLRVFEIHNIIQSTALQWPQLRYLLTCSCHRKTVTPILRNFIKWNCSQDKLLHFPMSAFSNLQKLAMLTKRNKTKYFCKQPLLLCSPIHSKDCLVGSGWITMKAIMTTQYWTATERELSHERQIYSQKYLTEIVGKYSLKHKLTTNTNKWKSWMIISQCCIYIACSPSYFKLSSWEVGTIPTLHGWMNRQP